MGYYFLLSYFVLVAVLTASVSRAAEDDGGRLFNITKILEKHSDYGAFNSLLSQHKVAGMINRRKTITVLVVKDTSAISQHPKDAVQRILMNHVVLDFYGEPKLNRIKKATMLTTMLQTTGAAYLRQGFINVTKEDGEVVMGSAVPDADHNCRLVGKIMMQPYDISVLEISSPIIAPGVDEMEAKDPQADDQARAPRRSRAPPPDISSPPEPEADEEEEVVESPADSPRSKKAKAPSPDKSSDVAGLKVSGAGAALMGLVWLLLVVA